MSTRAVDWWIAALLALGVGLLFTQLDNGLLWQDEAETAVLAKRVLTFGYPKASDVGGVNVLEIGPFHHGPGDAWVYHPWLPLYVLAGVFRWFGVSTWTARLPFAVCGWLSLYLSWRLSTALVRDRLIQRLHLALLVCSVPFLLHMRQCRYYAMTAALMLGLTLAYLKWFRRPTPKAAMGVGALLLALFYTNFGTCLPAAAALAAHQLFWGEPRSRRQGMVILLIVAALAMPWVIVSYQPAFAGRWSISRLIDHLEYYVRITNKYVMPLAAIAASWMWWRLRGTAAVHPPLAPALRALLVLLVGTQLAFLLIVPDQRHMRYFIPVLPVLLLGEAWWLSAWIKRRRVVGWAVALLALGTNILQSPHVEVPLRAYLTELTHPYRGPMEGVVEYLLEHGNAGDTVNIPYDDRTIMFYTPLIVERPSLFLENGDARWVVIRRDWIPESYFVSPSFRHLEASADRIQLDAPDILWQNREDPGSHHFKTVTDAPPVVIYRRRKI